MGDKFLKSILQSFIDAKTRATKKKEGMPYLHNNYNVSGFIMNHVTASKNTLANIVNAFTEAMNQNIHLPRFVIVVPDWDILKYINHVGYGLSMMTDKSLNFIITAMECLIAACKDELRRRRLGAIAPNEPKIIWINMTDHHEVRDKTLAVRNKFNKVLEEILSNR